MTSILLPIGLEDSASDTEPFVLTGWFHRVRPGKDYVDGSGKAVLAEWPIGGGWKAFTGATATLLLDPLAADNPYYLEVKGPTDPTSRDRKPVRREEYRQVLAGTSPGTSWYNLTRVSGPGPDATVYGTAGYDQLVAQIAAMQAQIDNLIIGGGGASDVTQVAGISIFSRTYLDDTTAAAVRTTLGAGTSSLAVGALVTDAKAGNYQPAAANVSDATTIGRTILTAADAAAVRTAIGAGSSGLVVGTTTGTAGDGGVLTGLVATVAALDTAHDARLDALEAAILDMLRVVVPVAGVWPARPATQQHLAFLSSTMTPAGDGSLSGGGGMVPDHDIDFKALP